MLLTYGFKLPDKLDAEMIKLEKTNKIRAINNITALVLFLMTPCIIGIRLIGTQRKKRKRIKEKNLKNRVLGFAMLIRYANVHDTRNKMLIPI
jgi:hypothetical protein